jgi:hypothetical protein
MYYGMLRVHPYAHPQHIKVLKHIKYIQYECGMQSMGFAASTMTPIHHTGSAIPHISIFFNKTYRDHSDMFLSELGYSELVQRQYEKMAFFLVDKGTDCERYC